MEFNDDHGLEELLALRRDTWEAIVPTEMNELLVFNGFSTTFDNGFDHHDQNHVKFLPDSSPPFDQQSLNFDQVYYPYNFSNSNNTHPFDAPPFGYVHQDNYPISNMEEEELEILADEIHNLEVQASSTSTSNCKMEPAQSPDHQEGRAGGGGGVFNTAATAICYERKNRSNKKLQGQPSKNLMAERRRRKRLNDRLSMLRSIVPKISKMDRTAILGDAIDYMKELLEKITNLQRQIHEVGSTDQIDMNIFKDIKPSSFLVRNSPKFEVERRSRDTRIEICCAGKTGLLLSTINTLEALGLEIQHCVISCFNDFAMEASCSEEQEQRELVSHDEIKQTLFRNAGYGGRCL